MGRSRPFLVTILSLGVLLSSGFHWVRLAQALRLWDYLESLPLTVSPLYLALTGGVFGLLGVIAAGLLWWGHRWAPAVARTYGIGVAAASWVDRALSAAPGREPWLLLLLFTILFLGLLLAILAHPPAAAFFKSHTTGNLR